MHETCAGPTSGLVGSGSCVPQLTVVTEAAVCMGTAVRTIAGSLLVPVGRSSVSPANRRGAERSVSERLNVVSSHTHSEAAPSLQVRSWLTLEVA